MFTEHASFTMMGIWNPEAFGARGHLGPGLMGPGALIDKRLVDKRMDRPL
jgi:hypothetical protein